METIKIKGKTFAGVPSVKMPTEAGGTAEFIAMSNLLKDGILRYDAEIVQSFNGDSYLVADDGVEIPTYSTSSKTLMAVANLTPTITLDYDNYDYFVVEKLKTIPEYNITTLAKGRQEYANAVYLYEVVTVPANTIHALIDTSEKVTSRNVGIAGLSYVRDIYYSSATAIGVYTATSYGIQQVGAAPTISSGKLTIRRPSVTARGHTTYFTSTFYNAVTDVRLLYDIDVYRAPKNSLNLDGWGVQHVINDMFENM